MENLRMSETIFPLKRSPSSALQGTSSKRQRLETIDTPLTKTDREMRRLRTHFRSKLSHIETSTTQLQGLRKQIEKLLEKESKKLELQAKNEIEKLEKLERHLDIENTPKDSLDLQTPQEVDLSPIKTPIRQKLLDLLPETSKPKKNLNFSGLANTSIPPDIGSPQEPNEQAQMTPRKLSSTSELNSNILPPQSPYYGIESQQCMVKIQKLNTEKILWEERKTLLVKAARVNELEEELQASRDVISALRDVEKEKIILEQQISVLKKALEHSETKEQNLRIQYEDLSKKIEEGELKHGDKTNEAQAVDLLRSENEDLRAQIDALKRENGEMGRRFEGGEDDEMVDITDHVKVEMITDGELSYQNYVNDIAGGPVVVGLDDVRADEPARIEDPEEPQSSPVRKEVSGSRRGRKRVEGKAQKLKDRHKDLSRKPGEGELKGKGKKKRRPRKLWGPRRAKRDHVTMDMVNYLSVEVNTDEGHADHQNYGHAVFGDYSISDSPEPGRAEVVRKSLREELRTNFSKQSKIIVGNMSLYPSSSTYFDIDFYSKFIKVNCRTFICKICRETYNTRPKMIDHIWASHYDGRWLCPYCSRTAGDRYGALMHRKKYHKERDLHVTDL